MIHLPTPGMEFEDDAPALCGAPNRGEHSYTVTFAVSYFSKTWPTESYCEACALLFTFNPTEV